VQLRIALWIATALVIDAIAVGPTGVANSRTGVSTRGIAARVDAGSQDAFPG